MYVVAGFDGDAGRHQLFVLFLSHDSARFRQLPAVDAANLVGILERRRFHPKLLAAVNVGTVRALNRTPLRFARGAAAQRVEQRPQRKREDPAVDFLDLPLRRRRVALLHDARDLPLVRTMRP